MAHVADRPDTYAPAFDALLAGTSTGPDWLRTLRREAFDRFQTRGFPTTRDEEWRVTPVAPIASAGCQPAVILAGDGAPVLPAGALDPYRPADSGAPLLVVVNGRFSRELSTAAIPAGVRVKSLLADAASLDAATLQAAFGAPDIVPTPFVDLNTAFLADALVLDVAAGAVVESALHVLCVTTSAAGAVMATPRVIVRVGEGAQVSIVESSTSVAPGGAATFANGVTQIAAAAGAIVRHVKLQREPATAFHLASTFIHLARGATVTSCAITLGGRIARNDVIASLTGEGAEVTLDGVYVADGDALIDTHTTIDHAMPHCPSHEVYKGILGGRARAVFNGKIIVRQDAQKTDAKQTNKALLLTDEAQINTKPQLEIFADDVKCTHGAAIGQLDDDALFYLRARGIAAHDARNLLIHAFAGEVLDRIGVEGVGAQALRLIDEKLQLV